MWGDEYEWNFDYVRVAWDSGFCFEKYKKNTFDRNKFYIIDIERIIKEKDLATLERHIPNVVEFVLDNEQADILDNNFVKMFRLSQLSIEYLLFCKKYLDHTVGLLKSEVKDLKSENMDLKSFIEELEKHITVLTSKINTEVASFKCEQCPKVFSSEDYLNAHIKRRHPNNDLDSERTDKSNLELQIKELKERLNSTEKLVLDQNEKSRAVDIQKPDDNLKEYKNDVVEIQAKFDQFKQQIEGELKVLQMQKSFFEDKYIKLLDIAAISSKNLQESTVHSNPKIVQQISTQTEHDAVKVVEDRHEIELEDSSSGNSDENVLRSEDNMEKTNAVVEVNILPEIEKKIFHFEEAIEAKVVDNYSYTPFAEQNAKNVFFNYAFLFNGESREEKMSTFLKSAQITTGLKGIENQMEAFWNRLSEIQLSNKLVVEKPEPKVRLSKTNKTPHKEVVTQPKPLEKPRTKFTFVQKPTNSKINSTKTQISEVKERKPDLEILPKNPPSVMYEQTDTDSTTSTDNKDIQTIFTKAKPSVSTLGKRSVSSLKKAAEEKAVLDSLQVHVEDVFKTRLQELGISFEWKGIPQRTFRKTMEIIKHQSNLTKKNYHEFDAIKENIEKTLRVKTFNPKKKYKLPKKSPKHVKSEVLKPTEYAINGNYVEKSSKTKPPTMYENSDTDTDVQLPKTETKYAKYASVVNELKTLTIASKVEQNDDNMQTKTETKGVLKSFPSTGSLTKKKVIFDIDSDISDVDGDKPIIQTRKDGGSTTSIASSVFDSKESLDDKPKSNKGYESLSDFDFNDL